MGAIVDKDKEKRQYEHLMALINAGYNEDETLFDPEAKEEEYLNECEAAFYEDCPVG